MLLYRTHLQRTTGAQRRLCSPARCLHFNASTARYCPKRGCFWAVGRALRSLGIFLNAVVALACFGLFGLLLYFNIAAAFKSNFFIIALCLAVGLWIIACSEVAVLSFFKFEVQHHVKSRLDGGDSDGNAGCCGEFSFMYRYILRESCSQFDSLPNIFDDITLADYCANPCERACSWCPGGRVCGWNRVHLGYVIVFTLCIILQLILMIVLLVPSGRDAVLAQLADNHADFWATRTTGIAIYYAVLSVLEAAWAVPLFFILLHRRVMFLRGRYDIYHTA